jgi:hypothetical protein
LERSRGNKRDLRRKRKGNWGKWRFPVDHAKTQEQQDIRESHRRDKNCGGVESVVGLDNIFQIRIGSILAFSRLFGRLADWDISKKSWNGDPRSRSQILMGESRITDDRGLSLGVGMVIQWFLRSFSDSSGH